MTIDTDWAIQELRAFLELAELRRAGGFVTGYNEKVNKGGQAQIVASAHVVEQILDRAIPHWRTEVPDDDNGLVNRWCQHIEAANRAIVALERDVEIREKLGDTAPQIRASTLHPWVWESAKALWIDGHYRHAVTTAAIKVNAETQLKSGVTTRSEGDLFLQLFKLEEAKPGHPRLRLGINDGSKTFISLHEGVGAFARGCYSAIRNLNSHAADLPLLPEHEALEQLAAFSQLARWIEAATVETAS